LGQVRGWEEAVGARLAEVEFLAGVGLQAAAGVPGFPVIVSMLRPLRLLPKAGLAMLLLRHLEVTRGS
jgi:hypothetical protein